MVGLIFLGVFILLGVAALWAKGIDEMHEKYPDYKGEDLFGEETKLQCKDCNDNLTDCTCIEDTIDMKQETLEEAAENSIIQWKKDVERWGEKNNFLLNIDSEADCIHGFKSGAKWQQERSYSEEDMKQAFLQGQDSIGRDEIEGFQKTQPFEEWFEQFKKQ